MKKYALIVDDDKIARLIHANLLTGMNYTIVEAGNGKEAIHQFLAYREQLAIVLMDYNMPEMDGVSATREIRNIESASTNKPLRIVGVTANTDQDIRDACFDAGMDGVVNKPVIASELEQALGQSLHLS